MKRNVAEETKVEMTGRNSGALSSKQSLFFHDIPPEFYRRTAKRYTVGHTKYIPDITMNLNWRQGLNDPFYIMDRLNHIFEHLIDFLENGDTKDDNLGAIACCTGWLMECERLHPEVLAQVIGQAHFSGKNATVMKERLLEMQNRDRRDRRNRRQK